MYWLGGTEPRFGIRDYFNALSNGETMQLRRQHAGVAAVTLILASCGGESPGDVSVVPAPTTSPSPPPSPPAAPTPPPIPSPTSVAVIEPYVIGSMTYTLAADIPADKVAAIRDSMDFAIAHTNTLAAFTGNVSVVFGAGTPTADASFLGQIRFGGSIGRRVALHELAHWLGSGSVQEWDRLVVNGRFTGMLTTGRMMAYEGPNAVVNADGAHFWPYGLNYDDEFSETQRNTQMVSAQFADMGLGPDAAAAIAGIRRLQNRSSELVLQGVPTGGAPVKTASAAVSLQQWRVSFADGFIALENAESGSTLASAGMTGNDAPVLMAVPSVTGKQQWEMLPVGEAGWFLLRNRETGNCLDSSGDLTDAAPLRLWGCGFHPNQQWRLIR